MYQALLTFIGTVVAAGTIALTYDDLLALANQSQAVLVATQQSNDEQLVMAAKMAFLADYGVADPSVEQLVDAGYLDKRFLTRQLVKDTDINAEVNNAVQSTQ